ncbi:hypothetical protein ES332_D12G163600v1 [Gossypium tomentosum]|uniref:Uncharacterized protein n=1 Tax=Gossypium tomentosum TaxID=34277 RepID=A0A5D2IAT5_GOSTO|nr:hypothetical protein ES332_D12G163600v1 [Gossypium tomentosum]
MKGSRPFPKLASDNGERPITANLRADSDAAVNRGKDFPFWLFQPNVHRLLFFLFFVFCFGPRLNWASTVIF